MIAHLEHLRVAELAGVERYFRPGMRVLEVGGGNGFQAHILASWGCAVTSIDVATRPSPAQQYYSVQTYNGYDIPFEDSTFDAVYSSNVLEHVRDLTRLCAEMRRVLVPGGLAIHFMPTPSWRFWTSLALYPHLLRRLVSRPAGNGLVATNPVQTRRLTDWLKRALFDGPHGEYPNAVAELYYFRRRRWLDILRGSGLEAVQIDGNGLFYSGYALLPSLPMTVRRLASRVLGSSCHLFVMRSTKAPSA